MQSGFRLVLAMTLAVMLIPNSTQSASTREAQGSSQPVVHTVAGGLVLEWQVPFASVEVNSSGETEVSIPDFNLISQPGVAQAPFTSALIALPPGAQPELAIESSTEEFLELAAPLNSAPVPLGVERDSQGAVIGGRFVAAESRHDFPFAVVELKPVGVLRGVELARVDFYPARPEGSQLRLTRQIRVTVNFNRPYVAGSNQVKAASDPLLERIKSNVVNPQDVVAVERPADSLNSSSQIKSFEAQHTAAIEVEETGIVAITYADLNGISFPLTGVNPANLRLTRDGVPIAYQWDGDGDAEFESSERLLFFAEPRFSRYTNADVYFLSVESSPGLRMSPRSGSPSGLPPGVPHVTSTAETNDIYTPHCYCAPIPAGRDGDRWVWDRLQNPGDSTADFSFELSGVDTSQQGTLNIWLIGFTDVPAADPDHKVDVILNDDTANKLGTISWNGKKSIAESLPIPANKLTNGTNKLTLSLPGIDGVSVEGVWLDAFQVEYIRNSAQIGNSVDFTGESNQHAYTVGLSGTNELQAYDITDPDEPVVLHNLNVSGTVELGDPASGGQRRYWVTNGAGIIAPDGLRLLSAAPASAGADYVIVAPGEFESALNPLAALRESQGYQVVFADLQAVYDHFGGGRPEPTAIREYLSQAYHTWNPQPLYVLLVGDGTSDPKRYQSVSAETILPPYLEVVDPWAGETAADNRFVTIDGSDNLPDMLIGRLPVNNLGEAQTVVDKIVSYETAYPPGNWYLGMTFVADNPDSGGNFPAQVKSVVDTYIPPGFDVDQLLYIPPTVSAGDIREQLLENWQAGLGLVMYAGHSSVHQWAVEKFFHDDDVAQLNNGGRLPVVLEMTCFTGSFQIPSVTTLDETLVRHPDGGAVAAWGATGLGLYTGQKALTEGFMENVFESDLKDLGSAALAGKLKLYQDAPGYLDLVDTYTLLGDPATRLNIPTWTDTLFVPLIQH